MRLVAAGVRFVSDDHGGWDAHDKIFPQMKDKLLPELDGGLAGLLMALDLKSHVGDDAGVYWSLAPRSDAMRAKIVHDDPERCAKIAAAKRGVPRPRLVRWRMSEAMTGRTLSTADTSETQRCPQAPWRLGVVLIWRRYGISPIFVARCRRLKICHAAIDGH